MTVSTPVRRRLGTVLAASALSLTGVSALSAPADAVIVPNYFQCSLVTGKCRQTNGPHNASVPDYCHWVFSTYWTGSSTRICDRWV